MNPEEFVSRLADISEHKGEPYGRAHLLFEEEQAHSEAILQFQGYLALSDAFKCFFLETVELLNTVSRPAITAPLHEFYGLLVPRITQSFKSLCAAERVAIRGYPYQGYSLLRNIFDDVVMTSAALLKITDFYEIEGLVLGEPVDPQSVKKNRKRTEFAVSRVMTGKDSGLSEAALFELGQLNALYDFEVHGARLSMALAQDWMKGNAALPVLPKFDEQAFAMFMNRYSEIAWIAHRTVPALQPSEAPLPESWKEKWSIVDDSFLQTVESMTKQLGKPVGKAFVEFVKVKFPFSGEFTFPY